MEPIFAEQTIKDFVQDLNSVKPMPGGGSAAAVCGAMAAALAGMSAHMTVGRKQYADAETAMQAVISETDILQQDMLAMAQEDADKYSLVLQAYKLPKTTEEESALRSASIEAASKMAVKVSMKVVAACVQILQLALEVVVQGNRMLVTDGAASALLARACQQVASYNVKINLAGVTNLEFKTDVEKQLKKQLAEGNRLEEAVRQEVEQRL